MTLCPLTKRLKRKRKNRVTQVCSNTSMTVNSFLPLSLVLLYDAVRVESVNKGAVNVALSVVRVNLLELVVVEKGRPCFLSIRSRLAQVFKTR